MTSRGCLVAGAVLGALAVALGAFGAHALRDLLDADATRWYATAVNYHATHALALFGCGLLGMRTTPGKSLRVCGALLLAGTAVFSGSLYLMAFTGLRGLGAVTPVGGVLLIAGWLLLAFAATRMPVEGVS